MTRKDYTAVAEAIRPQVQAGFFQTDEVKIVVGTIVENLCDTFAADNPRFDRVKFIEACGYNLSKATA
jgi:hypothetical protein